MFINVINKMTDILRYSRLNTYATTHVTINTIIVRVTVIFTLRIIWDVPPVLVQWCSSLSCSVRTVWGRIDTWERLV